MSHGRGNHLKADEVGETKVKELSIWMLLLLIRENKKM